MSESTPGRIWPPSTLLTWFKSNNITLHPNLSFTSSQQNNNNDNNNDDGASIYATSSISTLSTPIASIPKSAVLSRRTSSLPPFSGDDLPPTLVLATHVLHEMTLGDKSKWYHYLRSLPKQVPIVVLWEVDSVEYTWIQGTELERELISPETINLSRITSYYHSHIRPYFPSSPPLSLFLYTYSLISSRAFHVDTYHGLSLVPLADIFNHTEDNQVHFVSEIWVCEVCGKVWECEHDDAADAVGKGKRRKEDEDPEDEICHLINTTPLEAGQQVYNTYGGLSNAKLLAYYGFALEANSLDRITFPSTLTNEVVDEELLTRWRKEGGESDLLFEGDEVAIDAEARLSTRLWILLSSSFLPPSTSTPEEKFLVLQQIHKLLLRLHDSESDESDAFYPYPSVVLSISNSIVHLFNTYLQALHSPHLSGPEILSLAEEETNQRVRLAMRYTANERILVGCAKEIWEGIRDGASAESGIQASS